MSREGEPRYVSSERFVSLDWMNTYLGKYGDDEDYLSPSRKVFVALISIERPSNAVQ